MGHCGMKLIDAIGNSLLYNAGDICVCLEQSVSSLIGAKSNSLLYSVGYK
jgi:hypothetical protein